MKRFATIRNGKVDRVFVATEAALARMLAAAEAKAAELRAAIDVTELAIAAGYLYDAETGNFTAPPEPEAEETPSAQEQIDALRAEIEVLKRKKV